MSKYIDLPFRRYGKSESKVHALTLTCCDGALEAAYRSYVAARAAGRTRAASLFYLFCMIVLSAMEAAFGYSGEAVRGVAIVRAVSVASTISFNLVLRLIEARVGANTNREQSKGIQSEATVLRSQPASTAACSESTRGIMITRAAQDAIMALRPEHLLERIMATSFAFNGVLIVAAGSVGCARSPPVQLIFPFAWWSSSFDAPLRRDTALGRSFPACCDHCSLTPIPVICQLLICRQLSPIHRRVARLSRPAWTDVRVRAWLPASGLPA